MRILNGWVTWSVLSLGLLAVPAGRGEADFIYAADGQAGNPATNLYVINTANGSVVTTVGPIGFAVTGMAFDPATGVLYGVTAPRGTGTRELITINTATGAGTVVGPLGVTIDEISFASDGTLFAWSGRTSASSLFRINLNTGAATKVGDSGVVDFGVGFAINQTTGQAFLANAGASGVLRTVNLTTGAVTPGPTLTGAPFPTGSIDAFAFDGSTLLALNLDETGPGGAGKAPSATFLVSIDPTTGAVTTLGTSVPGLDALAFQPGAATVPEPSMLLLGVVGAIGLIGHSWWRRIR
jgi:hypothetical protein